MIGLSDQNDAKDKNIEKENYVTGSLNYGTKQMEYSKLEKQNLVYNFKKYLEANEANNTDDDNCSDHEMMKPPPLKRKQPKVSMNFSIFNDYKSTVKVCQNSKNKENIQITS